MNTLKKKMNKKGFTLAELLIVVAIIAVLVAISIPIFTTQLEKSRDAVSVANIRAAYAEAQTAVLSNGNKQTTTSDISEGNVTIKSGFNFGTISGTVTVSNVDIKTMKGTDDWSGLASDLDFAKPADGGTAIDNATVTFTYADGKITTTAYGAPAATPGP